VEPPVQLRLREEVQKAFGDKITLLESHAWREYGLTIGVKRSEMLGVFQALKNEKQFQCNLLVDVTAVDWMDRREPRFDVVYQLLSLVHGHRISVKVTATEEAPEVDSIRSLWPGANFLEREVWDMFGIKFAGHGDLRRILMYDEFVGHPLRKDYPLQGKQPRVALRVPELRNTSQDMKREVLYSLPVRQRMVGQE
jgi:NADH-quinone oxidoreductase subunit C